MDDQKIKTNKQLNKSKSTEVFSAGGSPLYLAYTKFERFVLVRLLTLGCNLSEPKYPYIKLNLYLFLFCYIKGFVGSRISEKGFTLHFHKAIKHDKEVRDKFGILVDLENGKRNVKQLYVRFVHKLCEKENRRVSKRLCQDEL